VVENSVDESSITSYKLYLANDGKKVGSSLGSVTKSSTSSSCCVTDKYHVDVSNVHLSGGSGSNYYFMVVPVDNGSPSNVELKFGRMSALIVDANSIQSGVASGAQRQSVSLTSMAALVGALFALTCAVTTSF